MNKLTQQYMELVDNLSDINYDAPFLSELEKKFTEIMDMKELYEFKHALPSTTTAQFQSTIETMHRAFIEGYLLAGLEDNSQSESTFKKYAACLGQATTEEEQDEKNDSSGINGMPISIQLYVPKFKRPQ